LETASNSAGTSTSRAQILSSQTPVQNWLSTELSSKPRHAYNFSARTK
jgi:hypothetical protein